jgi:hypothetical protein
MGQFNMGVGDFRVNTSGGRRAAGPVGSGGLVYGQVVNELPHPHPPVAFGFLKVKPDPIMVVT